MSVELIIRSSAEADIRESREMYERARVGLGDQFITQVREILQRIELMPEMYGIIWQDVRAARLKRFRNVVYYLVSNEHVEVIAVLHGSRDSSVWKSRI